MSKRKFKVIMITIGYSVLAILGFVLLSLLSAFVFSGDLMTVLNKIPNQIYLYCGLGFGGILLLGVMVLIVYTIYCGVNDYF